MDNMQIYSALRETPPEAQKTITAGRLKGFTDINPMWRIERLTKVFGPCGIGWWFEIDRMWIENAPNNEQKAFANIKLYYVFNGEVSKPVVGVGGSSFSTKEKNGVYTSDECFKMAVTDAIGSACKLLGMSADIYFAKGRTKYDTEFAAPHTQRPAGSSGRNANKIIDVNKQNTVLKLCEEKGINIKSMCTAYKIEAVTQMTEAIFEDAVLKLKRKPSVAG